MECPNCEKETKTKIIDKRNNGPNDSIWRRRECLECGTRFTTLEFRKDEIELA